MTAMSSACMSLPLSTIWKMRDLTVDGFFENEPTALRVAVQVDRATKRGPEQPKVEAEVRVKGRVPLLALDRRDGYFTLVEETAIDIKKTSSPATAKSATRSADA